MRLAISQGETAILSGQMSMISRKRREWLLQAHHGTFAHYHRLMRRFPPPWTVEALDGGFKIVDSNGQALAYVYGHADPRHA